MDLWVREARLFKYGSGTGSNFSRLRGEGEKLSGGGRSSGLMSFLKIGDRAAGAIKSGGTTRRAAKMVVVDADHPDIETYIDWKVKEEQKVAALVTGSKINQKHLKAVLKACVNCEGSRRRLLRSREEPGAAPRDQARAPRAGVRQRHQAGDPVRQAGLQGHRLPDLRHRLGFGGLSHRLRPELQQLGLAEGRFPARGRNRRRLEPDRPHQQEGDQDAEGPRPLGKDRLRRLGLGRSRPALQHHHERLAHLQGVRRHPRVQSVLGIHVPGRHRLQPRLRQPAHVLFDHDQAVRRRSLRASLPALDRGARNLRDDGAVPVAARSPNSPTSSARSASASPISAAS